MYRVIYKIGSEGKTLRVGDQVVFKHFATLEDATAHIREVLGDEKKTLYGLEECEGNENFSQRVQSFFNRF